MQAWSSKPPTYVDALESIPLTYGVERMVVEDGIDWEPAIMEPVGSKAKGSMLADIIWDRCSFW